MDYHLASCGGPGELIHMKAPKFLIFLVFWLDFIQISLIYYKGQLFHIKIFVISKFTAHMVTTLSLSKFKSGKF